MKLSRKKSWKVPQIKSDPSPQYPPLPERHDDSEDEDNYVKVCVFNNFLFFKEHSGISATQLISPAH